MRKGLYFKNHISQTTGLRLSDRSGLPRITMVKIPKTITRIYVQK